MSAGLVIVRGVDTLELDALMIRHHAVMECIRDFDDPMEALCVVLLPTEEVLKASLKAATIKHEMGKKRTVNTASSPSRAGAVSATGKRKVVERQSRGTPARTISWMKR